MAPYRKERLESVMEQLLAKEIVKTMERAEQLITITGISIDMKLERATVHVQVFPDAGKPEVLQYLGRHARQFEAFLLKKIPVKSIPHLIFE